ncbi:sigma-70 family RNA polymerase sigma factor [Empedobacter stercoris]|uniref:Sigma-70 family RNA polymerase sigma factor n=2 Tax=Empedobacter TaxID=59734 RepID=A0ABY8V6G1_9FLAO|nr:MULTISPECIES: sigma-70 family RNA polymerase sigma factor [Empedobacter]MCA4777189.1 sigma-70 family RNA polymerase sigma factor [Empedobacter stercoris]MCA4808735.1 sigma-70 family RNA polymerase sigma factor [Empedobacter stercoris]MDM1523673.1 sigma-70 family RNA polymerase sigma factor [Empedobacter sp. 225-1]MDM1543598.1 sigma-70 family RNA polymerase sigma factor [Empedobacter sp. 189-2]QNT15269.1 sigma-70 family RNA polymerase sigma factor [Empedobacter stercoris]
MDEKQLIKACINNDSKAQRLLYEKYDALFFAVCKRYFTDIQQAEDALVKGFLKIFQNLKSYSFEGSFEGWMRRIMINECLMELRKNKIFHLNVDDYSSSISSNQEASQQIEEDDVMKLLDYLPDGCRLVFTLYVIEGYKHKEIAENLGITEGTSKSQLNLAKTKLKEMLSKNEHIKSNLS